MDITYNILDFETTGFSADYDRVIEVGVVKIKNYKIIDTFQEFVNPGMRITGAITSLTGITNNMVKDADRSSRVMPRLKSFVGDELIVAHNASFDSRFYKAEMSRVEIYPKNEFLCSLLLARRMYQDLDSHKLGVLCNYLGFTNKASHRALGDAEATHKVFNAICERIKISSGRNQVDYKYLTKLSKVPKKKVASWFRV
ncbi:MAG: 3'-5' exonuclease [Bacteriovoracaceae bacterium]|nr:3'-5' exonuclease [Bacteriovoracaceae bacterium]